jgi:hypothetical protein
MIHRLQGIYKSFLREPLWFKILSSSTLLAAIVFSSSVFSDIGYYQSGAKLAAAIFFAAYGIKFRRNPRIFVLFFAMVLICIYLAWTNLGQSVSAPLKGSIM